MPGIEIKDLAGLAEVGCKLLDMVQAQLEPNLIVRRHRAEAKGKAIQALADIEIEEQKKRAFESLAAQAITKRQNLDCIMLDAAKLVTSQPTDGKVIEEDWLNRFILEAQDVSDERLQALWAKLLAAEFQSPGTYTRRLFRVVKDLDPSEAQLIDGLSTKVLTVEMQDGSSVEFLNALILKRTGYGPDARTETLGKTPVEGSELLEELGLLDSDYEFSLTGEGRVDSQTKNLSRQSPKKIYSEVGELIFDEVQTVFFGSFMTSFVFDAWKLTTIGKQVFGLSQRPKDKDHFEEIRNVLVQAQIRIEE